MIEEYRRKIPARRACELSSVSKTAYYAWRKKKEKKSEKDSFLLKEIERIVEELPGYGYRRVTAFLRRKGFRLNHKRILRVMRENNLTKRKKEKAHFYHHFFSSLSLIPQSHKRSCSPKTKRTLGGWYHLYPLEIWILLSFLNHWCFFKTGCGLGFERWLNISSFSFCFKNGSFQKEDKTWTYPSFRQRSAVCFKRVYLSS